MPFPSVRLSMARSCVSRPSIGLLGPTHTVGKGKLFVFLAVGHAAAIFVVASWSSLGMCRESSENVRSWRRRVEIGVPWAPPNSSSAGWDGGLDTEQVRGPPRP